MASDNANTTNASSFKRNDECIIHLAGHLTADPEIHTDFATFHVAVNAPVSKNQTETPASFFDVNISANYAKSLTWLKRGVGVTITGRPAYPAKQEGKPRRYLTIRADTVKRMNGSGNYAYVMLEGNLTRDPTLRNTQSGVSVCSLSVAVNNAYRTKDGEWKETPTSYFDITAWRETANFAAKYLTKGRTIHVVGRLQSRSYTDKNGDKQTGYDISVIGIDPISSRDDSNAQSADKESPVPAAQASTGQVYNADDFSDYGIIDDDDSDLPF